MKAGLTEVVTHIARNCPPMAAEDGHLVYTALVAPKPDGSLFIAVLVGEPDHDDDKPIFVAETLVSNEARQLAVGIEISAAGGGFA